MPTTRPRHSITETDDVAAALRDAAERWPEDRDHPAPPTTIWLGGGLRSSRRRVR